MTRYSVSDGSRAEAAVPGQPPRLAAGAGQPAPDILLCQRGATDPAATEALFRALYPELERMAARALSRHQRSPTLDTGSLVNEACLRLLGAARLPQSSIHLRAIAASAMRQIVVDHARRRLAGKRGGGAMHVGLTALEELGPGLARGLEPEELLELEHALTELAELGARPVQITECRVFAGMSEQETAVALGISRSTVQREWRKAQAWLQVLREQRKA